MSYLFLKTCVLLKILNTLIAAVDLLRTSCLSLQELQNVEEILEKLRPHISNISVSGRPFSCMYNFNKKGQNIF